jgi:hypothetical protein
MLVSWEDFTSIWNGEDALGSPDQVAAVDRTPEVARLLGSVDQQGGLDAEEPGQGAGVLRRRAPATLHGVDS